MKKAIRLRELSGIYAVARLPQDSPFPDWADGNGFVSLSRTEDELSVVCLAERVPDGVMKDGDWVCWKFEGSFAFDETGIVLSVIEPLSSNGLGIFVVSTFDGDHLLVKAADKGKARQCLSNAGHELI